VYWRERGEKKGKRNSLARGKEPIINFTKNGVCGRRESGVEGKGKGEWPRRGEKGSESWGRSPSFGGGGRDLTRKGWSIIMKRVPYLFFGEETLPRWSLFTKKGSEGSELAFLKKGEGGKRTASYRLAISTKEE